MASKHLEQLRRIAACMPVIRTLREPRPVGRRQDGASFARPYDYDEHDMVALAQYVAALEDVAEKAWELRDYAPWQTGHIRPLPETVKANREELSRLQVALDAALTKLKELS